MENLYINAVDLSRMIGISKEKALKVINQVNDELEKQGYMVIRNKPAIAPTEKVMERLGIK